MPDENQSGTGAPEPEKPAYIIEGARSARAKCKSCRKKIDKGTLRLGEGETDPPVVNLHLLRLRHDRSVEKLLRPF